MPRLNEATFAIRSRRTGNVRCEAVPDSVPPGRLVVGGRAGGLVVHRATAPSISGSNFQS